MATSGRDRHRGHRCHEPFFGETGIANEPEILPNRTRQHRDGQKTKAYVAFASLFVVLVLILLFGSHLHGWKLWLAMLVSVLFAIWAGATIGGFFGGSGEAKK